ncbi:MAG: alpha/beta fold hydrolase [Chitinophagaceae bacterium]|nr:alpha/beta fold hydrolase [Chitinophagaceae bacterium]
MKTIVPALVALLMIAQSASGQRYKVSIQPNPGLVKADPRLILQTGYLVVPENRSKPHGRSIRLPFFFVRRPDQDPKKNVSLYMTGGPGYSTTRNIDSISYNSGFLRYGGFIALDQRGTKRATPCLECHEVDEAIKESYRTNRDRDSLVRIAVQQCRSKFTQQGIDLSAYNSEQSAEDINDLRLALGLDSLTLVGISYSGGLMLATATLHPEAVRALILNSPLPIFTNYDEEALLNINEALDQVFEDCEKDSLNRPRYNNLKPAFRQYFTAITGMKFKTNYLEKGKMDSISITYTKNELLDAIVNRLNTAQVSTVPGMIRDIIDGKHQPWIREALDGYFAGDPDLAFGMRYSIICSEQISYADPAREKQQAQLLPWLTGYIYNNVDHPICDCWKVKPANPALKKPLYSNVPALISAGDIDPWCRPSYNRLIKKSLPNGQVLIFHDKGHGAGFSADGVNYLDGFMQAPFKKLAAQSTRHIAE